ncbi:LpxI family protein [Pseudaminobacter sp. NGMCC 1.201702]|uniref:LpxI family protein n=1 Tax=Pseudaminobacter sp. NGMCC 1.201702 TaxID=3391825 RepID=UPI0039F0505B
MTTPTIRTEFAQRTSLKPGDRIAIVAGSGRLPVNVAESLSAAAHSPFIVMIAGEVDQQADLAAFEHQSLPLEDIAGLVPLLKRHSITHVILAGGIGRRPNWRAFRPRLSLVTLLPRALAALGKGDDGLLRALVRMLEGYGFKVIGAHQVVPDLLAAEGNMTNAKPLKTDWRDLDAALQAARAIGALDIGQGAVSIGGRVVALEGIEGTDEMLGRVASLRGHGRIAGKKRGVLVKSSKPGQELRADLPTIGPLTVDVAHAAGLAGIGIEAGSSLILDYRSMVERADALGLFIVGLHAGKPQ